MPMTANTVPTATLRESLRRMVAHGEMTRKQANTLLHEMSARPLDGLYHVRAYVQNGVLGEYVVEAESGDHALTMVQERLHLNLGPAVVDVSGTYDGDGLHWQTSWGAEASLPLTVTASDELTLAVRGVINGLLSYDVHEVDADGRPVDG